MEAMITANWMEENSVLSTLHSINPRCHIPLNLIFNLVIFWSVKLKKERADGASDFKRLKSLNERKVLRGFTAEACLICDSGCITQKGLIRNLIYVTAFNWNQIYRNWQNWLLSIYIQIRWKQDDVQRT